MSTAQTVAEAAADELGQAGIDRVFGLPGGEVLVLRDALRRLGFTPQRPRPRETRADSAAQAAFKKGRSKPGSMPSPVPIRPPR